MFASLIVTEAEPLKKSIKSTNVVLFVVFFNHGILGYKGLVLEMW